MDASGSGTIYRSVEIPSNAWRPDMCAAPVAKRGAALGMYALRRFAYNEKAIMATTVEIPSTRWIACTVTGFWVMLPNATMDASGSDEFFRRKE